MTDLLYRWPAATAFGRRVPKEKLYEHGDVQTAVRERFIADVQRITWAHKLADTTINLPGSDDVPEIQVFLIEAKGEDVSSTVLTAIDRAIPFPIIFEIWRGSGDVRMTATPKRLGTGSLKPSAYFTTGWLPGMTERQPLPTAITLEALYTELLAPLLPVTVRAGEAPVEMTARLEMVRKLEREIATLERKLRTEPQFNRKVEISKTLKQKRSALDAAR